MSADRFRVEAPIQDGDHVILHLEGATDSRAIKFLAATGVACEEPDMGQLKVRTGTGSAFHAESVFRIELPTHNNEVQPLRYGQSFRLVHVRSSSYLTALSQEQCALQEVAGDATQCQFMLAPRYKLQQEGDVVFGRDNVMINSRLYQTVYLSIGSGAGVGLSTSGQGWVLSHFARFSTDSSALVKGGDVVRLQHAQREGYVTVCRADEELRSHDSPLVEVLEGSPGSPVGARVYVENGQAIPAPSCRSLLLLELQSSRTGAVLRENEPCRLKCEADGKYLSCDPSEGLVLRTRPELAAADMEDWQQTTLFTLVHVKRISELDTIAYDSFIYVKHKTGGGDEMFLRLKEPTAPSGAHSDIGSYTTGIAEEMADGDDAATSELELVPLAQLSDRDAFQISAPSADEVAEQFRVLKMQQELIRLYARLKPAASKRSAMGKARSSSMLSEEAMADWGLPRCPTRGFEPAACS